MTQTRSSRVSEVSRYGVFVSETLYMRLVGEGLTHLRSDPGVELLGRIFSRDQHGMIGAIERFAGVRLEKIDVDNSKFSRVNYGEYIRRLREYNERWPRRFGDRGGQRERGNYGAHGSRERYGPRHGSDRGRERGGFRHRDHRSQSHFGPSD